MNASISSADILCAGVRIIAGGVIAWAATVGDRNVDTSLRGIYKRE